MVPVTRTQTRGQACQRPKPLYNIGRTIYHCASITPSLIFHLSTFGSNHSFSSSWMLSHENILKCLQECEGCTHFCDTLYVLKQSSKDLENVGGFLENSLLK
ncbi:hypothetical protein CHARACLAT_004562 [Characodon lateralis]|uniref:Uncharacterized protein n=1 Tax=Characodon lateralis TaxID=208331 RepID=A0ABU7DQ18_9TELE|nr:hypothetical protein [Characodon lateralis]